MPKKSIAIKKRLEVVKEIRSNEKRLEVANKISAYRNDFKSHAMIVQ